LEKTVKRFNDEIPGYIFKNISVENKEIFADKAHERNDGDESIMYFGCTVNSLMRWKHTK
jgi:hypothetical protein